MFNIAEKNSDPGAWIGFGRVLSVEADMYLVQADAYETRAYKAAGCLLEPRAGDRVLLAWGADDEAFILTVLQQASSKNSVISHQGDMTIQAAGALNLQSENVNLDATEKACIRAGELKVSVLNAVTRFGSLEFRGINLSGKIKTVKWAADRLDTTVERIMERVARHYRRVSEFEDARIGRMQLWIKGLFGVKSESASIHSEEQVKVEADKILLG